MKNKILLIEPPFFRLYTSEYSLDRLPLGLAYLACTVKGRTDWEVMVYNADFCPDSKMKSLGFLAGEGFDNYLRNLDDPGYSVWGEVRDTIRDFGPSLIGISSKSQNFAATRNVARIAKELNPETVVIVGGPHPSMAGPSILEAAEIDIIARGEGEDTLTELIQWAEGGRAIEEIDGISFRDSNGDIRSNPPRANIEDLDALCFPHKEAHMFLKDHAKFPPAAFKGIFATRGCPFNCSFCGSKYIWTRRVRFRSPRNVVDEIRDLVSKGIPSIHFEDDTFGINKGFIAELCSLISEELPELKWSCEINIRLVDDETIGQMARSGCHRILIGIESGNNDMLMKIRKNITIQDAYRACGIITGHGIEVSAFFIIGFPEETEETLRDTIEAIKKVYTYGGDVIYSIFTPYPGTELFDFCLEHGLVDKDFNVSLYNHQSPLNNFTMNIQDKRFREISSELEALVDRLNRKVWLRRAFSLSTIKRIREKGISSAFKIALQLFGFKK